MTLFLFFEVSGHRRARTAVQTTREQRYCIKEETNSSFEDDLLTDSDSAQHVRDDSRADLAAQWPRSEVSSKPWGLLMMR